jgi:alpha-L-fucosidase
MTSPSPDVQPFVGRPLPQWYDDAKFGIFIHWGPYAVPCYAPVDCDMGELMRAGDWAEVFKWSPYTEWYLNSWALEGSPTAAHHAATYGERTYASFVEEFRARSGGADVAQWVPLFAQAGARYVVPVTKHHDGFLMWRSGIPNPHREGWMAERDHIAELATAVRTAGLRFGVYYSGGVDWTFKPPPIRDLAGLFTCTPDTSEYEDYATAQVQELIERFEPSVLWNDIAWPPHLDPNDIIGHYYRAVPDGVVNDRFNPIAVALGTLHADINTPEYSTPETDGGTPATRKWEVCRGIGRSFGYNRMESEATFPSVDELVWMLVDIVGRGGNLLLNVGPSADGQIPLAQVVRLAALGWWLRVNGDAVYGCRGAGAGTTADGRPVRYTVNGDTSYATVKGAPCDTVAFPMGRPAEGSEVRMLGNSRALPHTWRDGELTIHLPDHLPASPATVFAMRGW